CGTDQPVGWVGEDPIGPAQPTPWAHRSQLSRAREDVEELLELFDGFARGVDDRAPFLQRRRPPVLVFKPHPAVRTHLDHDGVHRFDVEPHRNADWLRLLAGRPGDQTPAAAEARSASATPITTVAVGAPSEPPPYAYSMFTAASATRFSAGARE